MGLLEFDKLPINTLVGADWKTFKAVTANKTTVSYTHLTLPTICSV